MKDECENDEARDCDLRAAGVLSVQTRPNIGEEST
jgi:hypothetical protein